MVDVEATSTDRTPDHDQVKSNYCILKEIPKKPEINFGGLNYLHAISLGRYHSNSPERRVIADEAVFQNPRTRDGNYCIPMHNSYILKSLFNIISVLSALCLDQFIFAVI